MKSARLVPLPELQVRRSAHIAGENSAAAKALQEHKRRIEQGEDVRFYYDQNNGAIVVGPRKEPA